MDDASTGPLIRDRRLSPQANDAIHAYDLGLEQARLVSDRPSSSAVRLAGRDSDVDLVDPGLLPIARATAAAASAPVPLATTAQRSCYWHMPQTQAGVRGLQSPSVAQKSPGSPYQQTQRPSSSIHMAD